MAPSDPMRTPNIPFGKKHLNMIVRRSPENPFFLLPSPFWIPGHDVNLEIEGVSFGFCFLNWLFQINIRKSSWLKLSASVDRERAGQISDRIEALFGSSPDPAAIARAFDANRWLRELTSRGIDETYYGLRVIRDVTMDLLRSERSRKEGPAVLSFSDDAPDSSGLFDDLRQ